MAGRKPGGEHAPGPSSGAGAAPVPFLDLRAAYTELQTEIDEAVSRVLSSGWYVLGDEVDSFEREFAAYCATGHCVGVSNGLDALELILAAMGIGVGDEVLVPSNTFVATWLAVTRVGATPVPVEPDPATHNLTAEQVGRQLSARTRAVIPVHLYGQPADVEAIRDVVDRSAGAGTVRIIEDAAQAQGARLNGRRTGGLGDAAAWSFYPAKNLGAFGDAGAVTTDDSELATRIRVLRNYGSRTKYRNELLGRNARLDELQAAVLRVKLRHIDVWNRRRSGVARRYLEELVDAPVGLPTVPEHVDPVWHLFVVTTEHRDALTSHLAAQGVAAAVHYPVPPHRQAAYAALDVAPQPVAEGLAGRVLSLPIGPHLSEQQASQVVRAVTSFSHG